MEQADKREGDHKKVASLWDWTITPIFILCFIVILSIYEILFRLQKLLPGLMSYQKLLFSLNRAIFFLLRIVTRIGFKVDGNLPISNFPLVIISNHQSMFDIPFLTIALSKINLRFIAKKQLLTGIPAVSIALQNGEHAIIDRRDTSQALPEIERVAKLSKEKNFSLVLFPEGTRSRDGNLKDFKIGGLAKIVETLDEVQVLPVAIDGSWKLAQFSLWPIIFKQNVKVIITDSFNVKASDNIEECLAKSKEQIKKVLNL